MFDFKLQIKFVIPWLFGRATELILEEKWTAVGCAAVGGIDLKRIALLCDTVIVVQSTHCKAVTPHITPDQLFQKDSGNLFVEHITNTLRLKVFSVFFLQIDIIRKKPLAVSFLQSKGCLTSLRIREQFDTSEEAATWTRWTDWGASVYLPSAPTHTTWITSMKCLYLDQ